MTGSDLTALDGAPLEVAPLLLGAVLRRGDVAVRLTEVEAYDGAHDPGSHAYRGETDRNRSMFGPAGHLYTYFVYGMHTCANVVCRETGTAGAVLLRAGEVVSGSATVRQRRPRSSDRDLARGPARLCRALGITLEDDGTDLGAGPVRLALGNLALGNQVTDVSTGPRVGLRHAADRHWRFWITGEPTVSAYRPAAPLRRRG